jgi:hypothetical protein
MNTGVAATPQVTFQEELRAASMDLSPILPDTAVTVLSVYWSRPMVVEDLDAMDPAQHARAVLAYDLSHAMTALYEDQALCISGIVPVSTADAVVFLFRHSAASMAAHAVPVARLLRRWWMGWIAEPGWYRTVVCRANMGDPAIDRLLRWLQFSPTGLLIESPHGHMLAEYRWSQREGEHHLYRT